MIYQKPDFFRPQSEQAPAQLGPLEIDNFNQWSQLVTEISSIWRIQHSSPHPPPHPHFRLKAAETEVLVASIVLFCLVSTSALITGDTFIERICSYGTKFLHWSPSCLQFK